MTCVTRWLGCTVEVEVRQYPMRFWVRPKLQHRSTGNPIRSTHGFSHPCIMAAMHWPLGCRARRRFSEEPVNMYISSRLRLHLEACFHLRTLALSSPARGNRNHESGSAVSQVPRDGVTRVSPWPTTCRMVQRWQVVCSSIHMTAVIDRMVANLHGVLVRSPAR